MTTRRISVFTRPDGTVIQDRPWDPDTAPSTVQPNPSAETLWPLVQVFLQFSREVQGGSVRRLVFRSPSEYTPEPQTFQPARAPRTRQDPLVAHIAHDELFVVVVTEICPERKLIPDDDEAAESIAELCGTVKDFLNTQQTAFLATLDQHDGASARRTDSHGERSNASTGVTEGSSVEGSRPSEEDRPPAHEKKPLVTIDEGTLSDFIAKTQTRLQL